MKKIISIIAIFCLIANLSLLSMNAYAKDTSKDYIEGIRSIAKVLDNSPTGLTDIMELPNGYEVELAADILDGKNPGDTLKKFVKGVAISKINDVTSIAGTLVNNNSDSSIFAVEVHYKFGASTDTDFVFNYIKSCQEKSFKINVDKSKEIDYVEIKRFSTANGISLLRENCWKRKDGKVIVDAEVINLEKKMNYVGIVATGYDKNNKPIETKCIDSFLNTGEVAEKQLILDSGTRIDHVEVKSTGSETDIKLLSSGYRIENGKVLVTGAIENGTNKLQYVGITATGYDKNNKPLETKCTDSMVNSGATKSYALQLDAANQIDHVIVQATGKASDILLLSSGYRTENGKVIVTGSVENGTNKLQSVGIAATGYDKKNKPIETKSTDSMVNSGASKTYTLQLNNVKNIKYVVVKASGKSETIQLLSSSYITQNGKVVVTGAIENGTGKLQYVGIAATGYDKNDKPLETKCTDSLVNSGASKSYTLQLDAATQIDHVIVQATGKASDILLLSSGYRTENGKVIVTGAVENGTGKLQFAGIAATGYDKNDKPLETKCTDSMVNSGASKSYTLHLDAANQIDHVIVQATGKTSDILLLSSGYRTENGKVIVTGAVENGSNTLQFAGIVATGYDKNGKPVETKCTDSMVNSRASKSYTMQLDAANQIDHVIVQATGKASGILLLSSGYRTENGKVIVTGAIENGSQKLQTLGITVNAYDINKSLVVTKSTDALVSSGASKSYTLELDKADQIENITVQLTSK